MRVISLFCGAGGMDLGFQQADHDIVWANDIDGDCVATYRRNIGDHVVEGPIEDIPAASIPEGDVVIGGFPCQGFSRANLRRSKGDSRNRLYLELIRVIQEKEPLYFAAENVSGILSLDGGRVVDMIRQDFEECGYHVDVQLHNMADYGVPQKRRRVIFLGSHTSLPDAARWPHPKPTHAEAPGLFGRDRWVTIGEALSGIPEPDQAHELKNHICSKYKVTNRDFTGHRRTDPDQPSPTILARGDGGGGVCALQHPRNHRRLSVRESAIVQSFPLDFEFVGSMSSMYRQVGNAVPPLFAKVLADSLSGVAEGVEPEEAPAQAQEVA